MSEQEIADKASEHSESFKTGSFFENIRYQSFEDGATWMQEEKDKEIAELKELRENGCHNIGILMVENANFRMEIAELKKQLEESQDTIYFLNNGQP